MGDVRNELENPGELRESTTGKFRVCVDTVKTNDHSESIQPQPGLSTLCHVTESWHCKTPGTVP